MNRYIIHHASCIMHHASCIILLLCIVLTSCHKRVGPTSLRIVDPERHYLPLVQGEDLKMNYIIVNNGRYPFIIQDIQPASLSIELTKEAPKLIPVGDSLHLSMVFHSARNIGYAEHKIRIFGNVTLINDTLPADGVAELTFDTHIVRPSLDQSDYEERYWEEKSRNEKLVDGTRGEQGYYTDEDIRENQLNDNYEFYPNHNRDRQVEQTVELLHLRTRTKKAAKSTCEGANNDGRTAKTSSPEEESALVKNLKILSTPVEYK